MTDSHSLQNRKLQTLREIIKPVDFEKVKHPKTVEAARKNLKRFYGCIADDLYVLLNRYDDYGYPVDLPLGERNDKKWQTIFSRDHHLKEPHPAINRIFADEIYYHVGINIDMLENLSDIYNITESGIFFERPVPLITTNLFVGIDQPLKPKLIDPNSFELYDNKSPTLSDLGENFFNLTKLFNLHWRWRKISDRSLRYFDLFLLGPLAPYQYQENKNELIAA